MARKKAKAQGKKVNFQIIAKPNAAFTILDKALDWHEDLHEARIGLAWRKATKADVDGHIVLGRCVKLSDLHKEFIEFDFIVVLNKEYWDEFDDEKRLALMDHELCLPGEVFVVGPKVELGTRRWYSGKMVEIATASGYKLSGTPNHPVLTDQGWVPLGLLNESDYVVSSREPERVSAAMYPNEYQAPSAIENVAGSVPMISGLMPQTTHDFYSDFSDGKVDVVRTNRRLLFDRVASLVKHFIKIHFGWGDAVQMLMAGDGHLGQRASIVFFPAPSVMGDLRQSLPLIVRELGESISLCISKRTDRHASLNEFSFDHSLAAPSGLFQFLQGGSGGVAFDQIVKRQTFDFSGHVFNLQTAKRWYHANHIVVHNCHAAAKLDDESGEQKEDERGRRVWRMRKHDIEEFREVVVRHGCYKRDLEEFAKALRDGKKNPLFAKAGKAAAQSEAVQ